MAWLPSGQIYVATHNLGVYFTQDFDTPAAQPTWTAVNTGLAALDCLEFHLDPFDQENKQYVLIDNGSLYIRENGGSWVDILSQADCVALIDLFTIDPAISMVSANIRTFCPDPSIKGKLWAVVAGVSDSVWVSPYVAIYSDDYGNTWHQPTGWIYTGFAAYGVHSIRAYG